MLRKQLIPLNFGQGVDTKTDEFQLEMGQFRRAENIIFETIKSFRKRNGYDSLEVVRRFSSGQASEEIEDKRFLTSYKSELVLTSNNRFYTYSPEQEGFYAPNDDGTLYPIESKVEPVVANAYAHEYASCLESAGRVVYLYHRTIDNILIYKVVDRTSGTVLAERQVDTGLTNYHASLGKIGTIVYIFVSDGTDIDYYTIDVFNPGNLSSATNIVSDLEASPDNLFDTVSFGNEIVIAYNSDASSDKLAVFSIREDGTTSSVLNISGSTDVTALNLFSDSLGRIVLAWSTSTEVYVAIVGFNLASTPLTATLVDTVSDVQNITVVEIASGEYQLAYEVENTLDVGPNFIKTATFNTGGNPSTPTVLIRGAGLAGKGISLDDGFFLAVHQSELQNTYLVLDTSGKVASKLLPSLSGGLLDRRVLPSNALVDESSVIVPLLRQSRLAEANGTFYTPLGVSSAEINFDSENFQDSAVLGDTLFINGGIVKAYDGSNFNEAGFHFYPEKIALDTTETVNGNMSDGNYGYVAVYMWIDNYGKEHRSAPSQVLDVTLSGGTSTQRVFVDVPALRATDKEVVNVELYRTEDNGTTFYRVTTVDNPVINDPTVDTISVVDPIADADLISREILYTTGGVLENIGPSAANIIASHTASNRIFYVGQDRNTLLYSKISQVGQPVTFNDTLQQVVDPIGGELTALAAMDEKLVIFKEDAILYISGRGPNNLGQQDDFSLSERISVETGCINKRSVVLTPNGLMFQSRKGIYLLSRGLQLQYIGAPVELFNGSVITSAKIVPEFNQVRFTTNEDAALVYNYLLGQWCTFTNHGARAATTIGNDYYYLRTDGELFKENKLTFSDAGTSIKMLVETGWMNLSRLNGFQRVYSMMFLGKYKSPHKLRVRMAYDYTEAYTQEALVQPSDFTSDEKYGTVSPYGEEETYGAANSYRARINMKQQKCTSIRFIIEEQQNEVGEGLQLSGVTFRAGLKTGTDKLRAGRRYAAS